LPRENPDKIGWEAMRIALAGYVNSLHLCVFAGADAAGRRSMAAHSDSTRGGAGDLQGAGAIGLFGIVAIGFLFTRLSWPEIVLASSQHYACSAISASATLLGFALAAALVLCNGGSARATRWRRLEPVPRLAGRGEDAGRVAAFTLAWTHSIEKTDWQEDWRITPQGLELVQARIKGFGAGMSRRRTRAWSMAGFQWQPKRRRCRKSSSAFRRAGEWRLCIGGNCRTLSEILASRLVLMSRPCAPATINKQDRGKSMERLKGKTAMVVGAGLDRSGLGQWQGDRRDLRARGRAGVLR